MIHDPLSDKERKERELFEQFEAFRRLPQPAGESWQQTEERLRAHMAAQGATPEAHGFPIKPDRLPGENRAARRARLKREHRKA